MACIQTGLKFDDLRYFTYVDILKMFVCIRKTNKNKKIKKATQNDIDNLLG